jgi:hypothetical protein
MRYEQRRSWLLRSLWVAAAFAVAFAIGCVSAPGQPHMAAALEELRAARAELDVATPDKGGHRVRAIELVDGAIEQVRLGIEFARTH